ncbi:MAG: hypothetical protein DMF63_13985 [Acidobacteria bacterium]|nr:MAG: hypothetical protein DMF63_13985 [Acidobacteriota bacterium]
MIRTLLLILGCISFIIVIGGATYEHAAVVPVWTSAVPASLHMFQGEYGLAAWNFWIPVHPITMVLLLTGLIANWGTERRNYVLVTILGYAGVLAVTFVYFVPELMSLVQSSYSATIDPDLTRRALTWQSASLVRLGSLIVMAIILLLGLSKPADSKLK